MVLAGLLVAPAFTACSDSNDLTELGPLETEEQAFGKATGNFTAEEWFPGGELGTTEKASYSAPTPAVQNIAGMEEDFNTGEDFFEHLYTFEQAPRRGLGPAWVRNSCIACHPSYGHGKRQTEYRANTIGNGYLLVIYHPGTNAYISEVTGMPQTQAMAPFKAPIDETQIQIEWKTVTAMESGLAMTFPDGESYSLIYPEVRIPQSAFNTNPKPTDYDVRLESTIGIYGTALLDAIDDEGIANRVYEVLNTPSVAYKETFEKYLLNGAPYNGVEEMSDKQYYQFMVWHRGLAVPAARNLNEPQVQRGKQLFSEIGCANCHRPSWTTGSDDMWVDASTKAYAKQIGKNANSMLPKYAHQTIWPYTDLVQHRLFMANDIRTGWCRTTPLWGRGLSRRLTGADDRLHDCRARTVVEAIMWHGYSKQSDGYRATEKFYNLPKSDRDAIVKFIESI